ncbi:MAG: NosD domain-containing protein, partial [Candidatus Hodarchaeota archaeon]
FSGHFLLNIFFRYRQEADNFFTNFIAMAPGNDFEGSDKGYHLYVEWESLMKENINGNLPKKLYLTIGTEDPWVAIKNGTIKTLTPLLESRKYSQFKFENKIYEGYGHFDIVLPSIVAGLHWLYEPIDEPFSINSMHEGNDWDNVTSITGNGSQINPYLIKDLFFDLRGYFTPAIEIINSNQFVILQNITIFNSTRAYAAAIRLINCTNVAIVDANIIDSLIGIELTNTQNITLTNANLFNSGVLLHNSTHNTFDSSNKVNDRPISYHENEKELVLNGLDIGQLILVNCTNGTISNFNISFTTVGILLSNTNNTALSDINASNNTFGLYLENSHNNTIFNSTFAYNLEYGVSLINSTLNEIFQNQIIYNQADFYGNEADNNLHDNIFTPLPATATSLPSSTTSLSSTVPSDFLTQEITLLSFGCLVVFLWRHKRRPCER